MVFEFENYQPNSETGYRLCEHKVRRIWDQLHEEDDECTYVCYATPPMKTLAISIT